MAQKLARSAVEVKWLLGSPITLAQHTLSSQNCYGLVTTPSQLAMWATKHCATYLLKILIFLPFQI